MGYSLQVQSRQSTIDCTCIYKISQEEDIKEANSRTSNVLGYFAGTVNAVNDTYLGRHSVDTLAGTRL